MPRHSFSYSQEFLSKLRRKIEGAFTGLQPERFSQEPSYTSALLGRLHGIEVKSSKGEYAKIETTALTDRGPNSAEKRYGADFVIIATVGNAKRKIEKAILVQVKNKPIDTLAPSELQDLKDQIKKMKSVVSSPKVAGIRRSHGRAMLEISSGNKVLSDEKYKKDDFPSYFNQRIITTLDGTTSKVTIDALQESTLEKLNVIIKS